MYGFLTLWPEMVLFLLNRLGDMTFHLYVIHSDAKRPCSTCVRSYAHAVAHAPKGAEAPPMLECTFDCGTYLHNFSANSLSAVTLVLEVNPIGADVPKNRYDTLESRISKLSPVLNASN
jgi:hypothetical protein